MITAQDMHALARLLVRRHGSVASDFADRAVDEMEALGDERRAEAWRILRSVVDDLIAGRLDESGEGITVH